MIRDDWLADWPQPPRSASLDYAVAASLLLVLAEAIFIIVWLLTR